MDTPNRYALVIAANEYHGEAVLVYDTLWEAQMAPQRGTIREATGEEVAKREAEIDGEWGYALHTANMRVQEEQESH